jgi:tetratricopeptide (TPR) repeat protein
MVETRHKLKQQSSQINEIKSFIQRHSALESVVAQGDYWLREGEEMIKTDEEKGKKLLDKALKVYEIAIEIDPNNIPARIGESKYYGACKKYKIALDKLNSLKTDLDKEAKEASDLTIVSDKSMARINYNFACYCFLDGIDATLYPDSDQRHKLIEKAFTYFKLATKEQPLYGKFAKLDEDWKEDNMSKSEKITFHKIVGQ